MEMSQRMQPARTRGNWCGPPHAWRFFGTVGKAAGRAEPRYAALAFQNVEFYSNAILVRDFAVDS